MKKKEKYIYTILFFVLIVTGVCYYIKLNKEKDLTIIEIAYKEPEYKYNEVIEEIQPVSSMSDNIVWDGLTEEELTAKLNKNLYHELSGTGKYFGLRQGNM